jgi:hypothetical protein
VVLFVVFMDLIAEKCAQRPSIIRTKWVKKWNDIFWCWYWSWSSYDSIKAIQNLNS